MQQIDIHTHQIKNEGNIQLLNIFAQELSATQPEYFFSAGLHPWHLGKVDQEECFQAIERAAEQKNMLAVGECGLDRSILIDFALQELCFIRQVQIAERTYRPLIIHCVRAYSDLLKLKKTTKSHVAWIIHGYRGNPETTLSLIKHGFYFSVGGQLLKNESGQGVLSTIPTDRLFLETDVSEISILKIYALAAQILRLDEKILGEAILNNFKTIFGDDKLDSTK